MNWIATQGKFDIKPSCIKYIPSSSNTGLGGINQSVSGIVKSNQYFDSGEISFNVQIKDTNSYCNLILNDGLTNPIYIGINDGVNAYSIRKWDGSTFTNLSVAGDPGSLKINKKIYVSVKVMGSLTELYIEEVKVCSTICNIFNSQIAMWIYGSSEVEVSGFKVKSIKPSAFIVMQFSKNYDELYEEVIRPTCEKYGFECIRADEIYTNGQIIEDVLSSIRNANLVIADITPDNPNVFYELGYAHGINKPAILLCDRQREKLPFDISGTRAIFYDNSISRKTKVEEALLKHLANIKA